MIRFDRDYVRLFSGSPFDDSHWSRVAADSPEGKHLNQRARMSEFRRDLRRRVRARLAAQRLEEAA